MTNKMQVTGLSQIFDKTGLNETDIRKIVVSHQKGVNGYLSAMLNNRMKSFKKEDNNAIKNS